MIKVLKLVELKICKQHLGVNNNVGKIKISMTERNLESKRKFYLLLDKPNLTSNLTLFSFKKPPCVSASI